MLDSGERSGHLSDDGELTTVAWLAERGFVAPSGTTSMPRRLIGESLWLASSTGHGCWILIEGEEGEEGEVCGECGGDRGQQMIILPSFPTRGCVRRLSCVFGFDLEVGEL